MITKTNNKTKSKSQSQLTFSLFYKLCGLSLEVLELVLKGKVHPISGPRFQSQSKGF